MTVLITGVTGLVGARLVPRLVQAGQSCRVLLRAGGTAPRDAEAVIGDILDPATLAAAVAGVSAVVHLAAVSRSQDSALIWRSNLEGTRNLIAAAQAGAAKARFILASTSNVYDIASPHPWREEDEVTPAQAYPASKVAAERALKESGLTWSILRFPFVYGDGNGHLESLPDHVGSWHPAHKISTLHHRDIATGIGLALAGAFDRRIVNLTDEAAVSIFELAAVVGKPMAPSAAPLPNPWHLHVDGSLARSLGYRPTVRTVWQAQQEGLL